MKLVLARSSSVALFPLLTVALASACGSAPPPPAKTTPAASASAAPSSGPAVAADLTAVPEPQGLVLSGRFANATKLLNAVHGWSQLPMPKADAVTEIITTEAAGDVVDLDQPIDFAIAVQGAGLRQIKQIAVSAAVKDPEKAKAAFSEHFKLVPGENGALVIEGIGRAAPKAQNRMGGEDEESDKSSDDANDERRHCELAPAYGASPTRLVCGFSLAAMQSLAPYLTRTATRASVPSDVHVEFRTSAFKPLIASQKPMIKGLVSSMVGMRGFNPGVRELAGAFGMDFADFALDLDQATIDAQVEGDAMNSTLVAKFGSTNSSIARLATSHPEKTGAPPPSFWQLPADSEIAYFYRGIDAAQFDSARDLVVGIVAGQLAKDGVDETEKNAFVDAVKKLFSGAPGVYGAAVDAQKVRRAFADVRQKDRSWTPFNERAELRRTAIEAILGWRIFGIDEPAAKFVAAAKDVAAAWSKPQIAKAYKTKFKDNLTPSVTLAPAPKGVTLPKDSAHLELSFYPFHEPPTPAKPSAAPTKPNAPAAKADKPAGPPKPIKLHALIAGDASRTWIVVAADEATLVAKANAVLNGQDGDRLSGRQGIEAVKSLKAGAGGFFTERAFPMLPEQLAVLFSDTFYGIGEHYDDMTSSPHGGATPIPFAFTAQDGSTLVASAQLSKPAIEDFVVAVIKRMVPSYGY